MIEASIVRIYQYRNTIRDSFIIKLRHGTLRDLSVTAELLVDHHFTTIRLRQWSIRHDGK